MMATSAVGWSTLVNKRRWHDVSDHTVLAPQLLHVSPLLHQLIQELLRLGLAEFAHLLGDIEQRILDVTAHCGTTVHEGGGSKEVISEEYDNKLQ